MATTPELKDKRVKIVGEMQTILESIRPDAAVNDTKTKLDNHKMLDGEQEQVLKQIHAQTSPRRPGAIQWDA